MAEVLLEIGTEEIPARFMQRLLSDFKTSIQKELLENNLTVEAVETYGTDRRVALIMKGLLEKQPDIDKEIKGPPAEIAFKDGELTSAGIGFCKKNGLDQKKVAKKEIGGKEYLYARIQEKGRKTKDILPEIYQKCLLAIHLPIAMRWGSLDVQFIRPIHWLVSLYNDAVLKFEFAGIKAKNRSRGHRFISNRDIVITEPKKYFSLLEKNHVYVDQNVRRDMILAQLKQVEQEKGLTAIVNEELLWEVTYINECPKAVVAEIEEKYLAVPQECLITTMQKNQKYFPLVDKHGRLTKYFVLIANNVNKKSLSNIIKGNVKVVTARLEDAKFFYEEDLKINMDKMVEGLKQVTYQEKIGTIYQKIERVVKLANWLGNRANLTENEKKQIDLTARIAKADLNSKMVYEFPELQGTMGCYYAKAGGKEQEIAEAIRDHWKPRYAGEDISKINNIAAIVSIADKMDTIASCFSTGLIPSSSSDPYALRRAAQGIVSVIYTKKLKLDIEEIIKEALHNLSKGQEIALIEQIKKFFESRLEYVLKERDIKYDVIKAVSSQERVGSVLKNIIQIINITEVIEKERNSKIIKDINEMTVRIKNIVKNTKALGASFFKEEISTSEEKELYKKIQIMVDINEYLLQAKYLDAFTIIAGLKKTVDTLFEKVLINDENKEIRENRINLLQSTLRTLTSFADLSHLVY